MTLWKRFGWFFTLSLLLVAGCSAVLVLHWKSEEYAVYEATIREAFSGDGVSYYMILDTTQPMGRFGVSSFHSEKLGLPPSARASYTAKNLFRFHIPPSFRLQEPSTMVNQKDLDLIYAPG